MNSILIALFRRADASVNRYRLETAGAACAANIWRTTLNGARLPTFDITYLRTHLLMVRL